MDEMQIKNNRRNVGLWWKTLSITYMYQEEKGWVDVWSFPPWTADEIKKKKKTNMVFKHFDHYVILTGFLFD